MLRVLVSDCHVFAVFLWRHDDQMLNPCAALESLRCHPDAILVGTGAKNGVVSLWDLRDRSAAANLSEHSGAVKALAFSENG